MRLTDYVNHIFDIAHENDVDVGVAKDMFMANVQAGNKDHLYHGADQVDYDALKPHYEELANSQDEYNNAVRENFFRIVKLREDGKYEDVVNLLNGNANFYATC